MFAKLLSVLIPISIILVAGAIVYFFTKATSNGTFGTTIIFVAFAISMLLMFNPEFEANLDKLIQPQETTQTTENAIDVPDGYKFVDMDDEGRYYIIEDAEGNQQVIIIEKNEK